MIEPIRNLPITEETPRRHRICALCRQPIVDVRTLFASRSYHSPCLDRYLKSVLYRKRRDAGKE